MEHFTSADWLIRAFNVLAVIIILLNIFVTKSWIVRFMWIAPSAAWLEKVIRTYDEPIPSSHQVTSLAAVLLTIILGLAVLRHSWKERQKQSSEPSE